MASSTGLHITLELQSLNWGYTKVWPHLASVVSTSLRHRRSWVSTAAPFSGNDHILWLNCLEGGEVVMTSSILYSLELIAHRQPATKIAHWDSLCLPTDAIVWIDSFPWLSGGPSFSCCQPCLLWMTSSIVLSPDAIAWMDSFPWLSGGSFFRCCQPCLLWMTSSTGLPSDAIA